MASKTLISDEPKMTAKDYCTTAVQIVAIIGGVALAVTGNVPVGVGLALVGLAGGSKGSIGEGLIKFILGAVMSPKGQMSGKPPKSPLLTILFWLAIMAGGCSGLQQAAQAEMDKIRDCNPIEVKQVTTCQDGRQMGLTCQTLPDGPSCLPIWTTPPPTDKDSLTVEPVPAE